MRPRYGKAIAFIIIAFAVGLIFFFIFSAEYGDGLEKTMEKGNAEEEQVYSAPLDYGDSYLISLVMGIAGFIIVLLFSYMVGRFLRRKDEAQHR